MTSGDPPLASQVLGLQVWQLTNKSGTASKEVVFFSPLSFYSLQIWEAWWQGMLWPQY